MSTREEAAAGFRVLTEILNKAGLRLRNSNRPWQDLTATYVEFGTDDRSTNIVLSDEFLSDLPNTREHRAEAESYAATIAGRIKCGPPNAFYCRSGIPIDIQIHWPIRTGFTPDRQLVSWLMVTITNELDGTIAICSLHFSTFEYPNPSLFQRMENMTNRMRDGIDDGTVKFVSRETHSSNGQIIEQRLAGERRLSSEEEIERFLIAKSYDLGFRATHSPRPVWVPDPWDASYLGTTRRALSQAAHVLQARKLITLDSTSQYASPSDKLLSDGPGETPGGPRQPQKLSLSTVPNKERFESYVMDQLQKGAELALIFVDLDHFKSVNDTLGHQAGDACLESVIQTMAAAISSKGSLYRWGGDEFAVCLPHFSTEEAAATAERIRRSIENSSAGGTIAVTASIGLCATDQITATSPAAFIKAADDAMYSSKKSGKNRVTVAKKAREKALNDVPRYRRRPL